MMLTDQDVVKRPLITEKSERGREAAQQYSFEVDRPRQEQARRQEHRPPSELEEGGRDLEAR